MLIKKPRIPVISMILMGFLPCFLKKFIYRLKGYKIGKKVSIGMGTVIIGKNVSIGNETKISFLTLIRGNTIKIGSFVSIGCMTALDTPHTEIGDGTRITEQVVVGGMEFPSSKFIVGKNSLVMMSYINAAYPITIGDDVAIGGDNLICAHGAWLSKFDGFPIQFAPIEIGNNVYLAWRVFVLPGTKIGDRVIIGANSLVRGEIPSDSLAVGSPAKVIKQAPDFPKHLTEDEKKDVLKEIMEQLVHYFVFYGISNEKDGDIYKFRRNKTSLFDFRKQNWRMLVQWNSIRELPVSPPKGIDVFLSLKTIPENIRQALCRSKIMWIDIERKEKSLANRNDLGEEVVNFFRRYGVRYTYV